MYFKKTFINLIKILKITTFYKMGLYIGKNNIIAINEKVATKQWVTD